MERITNFEELKNRLVEMISKGIEVEEGVYRKMDPMDYYDITEIEPKKLYQTLKENISLTPHERSVIISYAAKCNSIATALPKDVFVKRIMDEKLIIKGVEISPEMKEEAVSFMENNGIPFAYYNYVSYIRRVVDQLVTDVKRD